MDDWHPATTSSPNIWIRILRDSCSSHTSSGRRLDISALFADARRGLVVRFLALA